MKSLLRSINIDRESFFIILIGGVLFGLGAMLYKRSAEIFILCFLFGSYASFVALPSFDRQKWKPKPLICAVLGMMGAIGFAWFLNWASSHVAIMGAAGFLLGYLGQYWIRYL